MNVPRVNDPAKLKNLAARYNMMANLFWSVISLTPISIFCYTVMNAKLFWIFLVVSLLTGMLPKSFFDSIQLGKTKSFYKNTGVLFINKFTQNGGIVNSLIRKTNPQYKVVSNRNVSAAKLLSQTYVFEKFHFILFVFFTLSIVYALLINYFLWALIIAITNLIYNIYPIFLQQYLRLRLKAYRETMRT